jgi:hypothetical protein
MCAKDVNIRWSKLFCVGQLVDKARCLERYSAKSLVITSHQVAGGNHLVDQSSLK